MAKDYFQDITPPNQSRNSSAPIRRMNVNQSPEPQSKQADPQIPDEIADETGGLGVDEVDTNAPSPQRTIRNIAPARTRPRPQAQEFREGPPPMRPRGRSRMWLWLVAIIAVLAVGGLALFAFRNTTVTITPRTQAMVFNQSSQFTAYPAASAASGTLAYTVKSFDLDDSEVVASKGTEHAETKASGSITAVNAYSPTPVKLIKNTRFESSDGHIFRVPADVVVPGMNGSNPGQVNVTVVADATGEGYNVAAGKFTLPGLKTTPAMYAKVYGMSTQAMSGGFAGDRPAVDPAAMQAALSTLHTRLIARARASASSAATSSDISFPDLTSVTLEDMPSTPEANSSVRLHETAHVSMPVFSPLALARTVASGIASDAETSDLYILPGDGYGAQALNASSTIFGSTPIAFVLVGQATLVWNVDKQALAAALAGRDQSAFTTIVTGFPGIQEAHARIEPFWNNSFPADPAKISIVVGPSAQ